MRNVLIFCILLSFLSCSNQEDNFKEDTSSSLDEVTPINSIFFENDTCRCPEAAVGDSTVINGIEYIVVDNSTISGQLSNGNGNLCTTFVTDMFQLFKDFSSFDSEISFWDTSNVIDMQYMFDGFSSFNQNIGNWDTSSVLNMQTN